MKNNVLYLKWQKRKYKKNILSNSYHEENNMNYENIKNYKK